MTGRREFCVDVGSQTIAEKMRGKIVPLLNLAPWNVGVWGAG